jgi:lipopolysaccharide export system protein LptA
MVLLCAGSVRAAGADAKQARDSTLKLKAKSIVFDRGKGDLRLEGEVVVTRRMGEQAMTVRCDRMTAKMVERKMERVEATGHVQLEMEKNTASAARAEFDFERNLVRLYGTKEKPATLTSPGVVSTGPEIILYLKDQRVEMPKGGDTILDLKSAPEAGGTS